MRRPRPTPTAPVPCTRVDNLAFVSSLGSNLDPAAAVLAARVGNELSIPTSFDAGLRSDQRRARIGAGTADIMWMCGLEAVLSLDDGELRADVVAAPVFAGQADPVYHSVIVVPADSDFESVESLAGSFLVINETGSWSGYHALRAHLAEIGASQPFFRSVTTSGHHLASLEMVAGGGADCAAIDHTIWEHAAGTPVAERLRVVGQTRDWPSPPILVSHRALEVLGDGLTRALIGSGSYRHGSRGTEVETILSRRIGDYEVIKRTMDELGPVPGDLSR